MRSSIVAAACFFAIVVDFGSPTTLIVPYALYALSVLTSAELVGGSEAVLFGCSAGSALLGVVWVVMAHCVPRRAHCAVLILCAMVAFTVAIGIVAVMSTRPALVVSTAAPFGIAAAIKIRSAIHLMSSTRRVDWQLSIRDLLWFGSSFAPPLILIAYALHAPAIERVDPKTASVHLVAYGATDEIIEEATLSYHGYLSGQSRVIEDRAYRAKRGITRIVISVSTPNGVASRFENSYHANGDIVDDP